MRRPPDRYARQRDVEGASAFAVALRPDASAVAIHDLLTDVEAEPHPRLIASGAVGRAVEEPEDRLELLIRDADPLISYRDPDPAILPPNIDHDRTAAWRVFDRVRHEVVEHLLDVIAIGGHHGAVLALHGDLMRRRRELHTHRDFVG